MTHSPEPRRHDGTTSHQSELSGHDFHTIIEYTYLINDKAKRRVKAMGKITPMKNSQ